MEGNGREGKKKEIQFKYKEENYTKYSFDRFPWIRYLSVELYIICLGPEGQNFPRKEKQCASNTAAICNTWQLFADVMIPVCKKADA